MIERASELPLFGPEEQIRKFFNETIYTNEDGGMDNNNTNQILLQKRIGNLDAILQKQLIWSIDGNFGEAYFYWDWCPMGNEEENNYWQLCQIEDPIDLKIRDIDRVFDYTKFKGYRNDIESMDEKPIEYDSSIDLHAKRNTDQKVDLDKKELLHNIMKSYIEVSEWLGDGCTEYGSHNGYVSRKMSLAWLFDAIRALINFKMDNQNRYAEKNIHPLSIEEHNERFLQEGETSDCGISYDDHLDLDQESGRCSLQIKARSSNPNVNGVLKVRGNAWFYGERADFYTHNSFMGECRFFHNTRFLGQATFDKEINGTVLRARWGDICEYYISDKKYEPGTLVMFGGEKEVTISNGRTVNGIVTTKPGFILNGDATDSNDISVGIALSGKVPVKVVGVVRKFDKLVTDFVNKGYARARKWYEFWKRPIGIALNDNHNGMVDCVTKLTF